MTTTEHEFDFHDGRHSETGSHVRLYYDYANRKFASRDLVSGRRSVDDFAAGISFSIDGSQCRSIHITRQMPRMCFPENVEKIGSTQIGGQLPVSIWQYAELGNVTIRTIVTTESCVPISEDVLVNEKDYVSVTSTLYSDVTLNVVDDEAFQTPSHCQLLTGFNSAVHELSAQEERFDLERRRRPFTTAAANRSAD